MKGLDSLQPPPRAPDRVTEGQLIFTNHYAMRRIDSLGFNNVIRQGLLPSPVTDSPRCREVKHLSQVTRMVRGACSLKPQAACLKPHA